MIFFDCDDCLYKNDWKVANMLTRKIESFCAERLQMKEGYAYELYKKRARACEACSRRAS